MGPCPASLATTTTTTTRWRAPQSRLGCAEPHLAIGLLPADMLRCLGRFMTPTEAPSLAPPRPGMPCTPQRTIKGGAAEGERVGRPLVESRGGAGRGARSGGGRRGPRPQVVHAARQASSLRAAPLARGAVPIRYHAEPNGLGWAKPWHRPTRPGRACCRAPPGPTLTVRKRRATRRDAATLRDYRPQHRRRPPGGVA